MVCHQAVLIPFGELVGPEVETICITCQYEENLARAELDGTARKESFGDSLNKIAEMVHGAFQPRQPPTDDLLSKFRKHIIDGMSERQKYQEHLNKDGEGAGELRRSLLLLENDVDANGWDQPARLYVLTGELSDPSFQFVANIEGHPREELEKLSNQGWRAPKQVVGIAMANEAYRHLHLDEVDEDVRSRVMDISERLGEPPEKTWMECCLRMQPSQLGKNLRREVRTVFAVFRDGTLALAQRERGKEEVGFDMQDVVTTATGGIATTIWMILTGGTRDELARLAYAALGEPCP